MVTSWVLHVDLDQFIAAVEVLRHPKLKGKPIIVGGDGDPLKRGVVSTASYEAREFGIRSGMPLRTALKKCPDAVFLPVDGATYEAISAEVMATLREFPAVVEVLGWDEAFLAIDDEDPDGFAGEIQDRVRERTQLNCTVGIGQNKLQAKIATNYGKPAGIFTITSATWFELLGEQPPDAIWGIGVKTRKKLAALDINTVRDLADADPQMLAGHFGPNTGPWLVQLGSGDVDSPVVGSPYIPRSRGREITFQSNLEDWNEVQQEIIRLAHKVTKDVVAEDRPAVRVVVKVRYAPFITATHGHPLDTPTFDPAVIEKGALAALEKFPERKPVRLLGVRADFGDTDELRAAQERGGTAREQRIGRSRGS